MKHVTNSMVLACVVAAVSLAPQRALAQGNPRMGTWILNVAESAFQQGTVPASDKRVYLATADGGIQMTSDAVLASGTKQPTGYRAKYDGRDYPYSGIVGDTIAISGDGSVSDTTIKLRGKITEITHIVISKDGKTMTLTTKTAAGNPVSTRVFHKQ